MYNFSPHEMTAIEQMKNMAPQQQQEYINSKIGQMPIWQLMAIQNEVKRQERMRSSLPQQQPPQTTVAQDLQQKLSQGLASQPVQNVGNPQSYATGGIVAFDDGGEVQHFDGLSGSEVQLDPTSTQQYLEDNPTFFDDPRKWLSEKAAKDNAWRKSVMLQGLRNKDRGIMNMLTRNPESWAKIGITQQEIDEALKYTPPVKGTPAPAAAKPTEQAAAPDYEGLAALIGKQRPNEGAGGKYGVSMPSFGAAPDVTGPDTAYLSDKRKQLEEEKAKLGIGDDAYIEKEMAARTAREEKLGLGKAQESQAKRLEKMEKDIPSSEKGFWRAVAKAGFALAGAKNWAEGIRAGGQEGIAAYEQFQDHRRDLQEKYANAKFQLEAAQEAVRAGRLSAAEAGLKEQKGLVRGLQDQIASGELAAKKFALTEAGENYRAELARKTQIYASQLQANASLKGQELIREMISLTDIMNNMRNPIGIRVAAQEKLENRQKAVGGLDVAQAQGDIAKVKEQNAALAGMMPGTASGFKVLRD